MTIQKSEITVSLGQLMLDPNNYRLNTGEDPYDHSVDEIKRLQPDTLKKLVGKNISDIESSILLNGFLEVDKIVVRALPSEDEPHRYLVVEGNRRTAAFKSLMINNYDSSKGRFYDDFPEGLVNKSSSINVILIEGKDKEIDDYARRLMGIRHVSGPKQWGAYQSARLINDMVNSEQDYKEIGALLGMRPKEVQKKHEAYSAFHQMKANPEFGSFADPALFSLFVEAVGANEYFKNNWLGWDDKDKKFHHESHLMKLYQAITPDEDRKPQLNNPTIFREYARSIKIPEVREQISQGVKYHDIEYDFDHDKRIKRISDFIAFFNRVEEFSKQELTLLKELRSIIDMQLSSKGDI